MSFIDRWQAKYQNTNKKRLILILSATLIPFIFLCYLITKFGVNVPYLDQWALVTDLEKFDSGTWGIADLWRQHNEHRIVFPRLILLVLAKLTHWYTPAEILASIVFASVGFVLLFDLLRRSLATNNKPLLPVFAFLFSAWYFSPVQWENWLWGWQVEWFMCVFGAILASYSLYRHSQTQKLYYFILAILGATLATFSLGGGILVWLVGVVALLGYTGVKLTFKYTWAIIGVLQVALYYFDYKKPPYHPPLTAALHKPLDYLEYLITTLGRPVTNEPVAALFAGCLLVVAGVLALLNSKKTFKTKDRNLLVTWYALAAYGLMGLGITSASRLGFGIPSAMSSRYTAFSILCIVGLLGVWSLIIKNNIPKSMTHGVIVGIVLLAVPLLSFSYVNGYREMENFSKLFVALKVCTHEEIPSRECVLTTYPPSETLIRQRLQYIKDHDYADY